jgi:peptidoglycan/LPS O-acetylase OafA/YrhL
VRIYPTYLPAVLIAAPITAFVGKYGLSFHGLSLLLVPAGQRSYYLGVERTLVIECTYYVALFLIAVAGWQRHLNAIAMVWLGLVGIASFIMDFGDKLLFPVYLIWLSTANVAFAGGLLIPWAARNIRIPVGTGFLALGAIMVVPPVNFAVVRWAVGAAAALLVLDAIRIKLPQRVMLGLPILGDWSYALYLIHVLCVIVAYSFWPASFGVSAAWLSAVAGTLILAAAFGTADVWIYQRLKSTVDALYERERRWRVNVYAGVFVIASLVGSVI